MSDIDIWIARYEQLNERSRWYTSQLWYVPFAYVALLGFGLEKAAALQGYLSAFAYLILAVLSFGTFIHVLSVKYFERRAVRAMQKLEAERTPFIASGGASNWRLSFSTYLRLVPLFASFVFVWMGTGSNLVGESIDPWPRLAATFGVLLFTIRVWQADKARNAELVGEIRDAMDRPPSQRDAA